jgi:hypothetical protein
MQETSLQTVKKATNGKQQFASKRIYSTITESTAKNDQVFVVVAGRTPINHGSSNCSINVVCLL